MHVITLANRKGGAGKTSTAVPLATLGAAEGRTVLIDLDHETASASQWHRAADLGDLFEVRSMRHDQLGSTIDELRAAGDVRWVVIDTPAVLEQPITSAMGESDMVLLPVHNGTGDLAQLAQTAALLRLPLRANPRLQYLVVINHAGRAPAVTRQTRQAIVDFGLPVATTEIPDLVLYSTGKGVRPGGKWWHYDKLFTEIKQHLGQVVPA